MEKNYSVKWITTKRYKHKHLIRFSLSLYPLNFAPLSACLGGHRAYPSGAVTTPLFLLAPFFCLSFRVLLASHQICFSGSTVCSSLFINPFWVVPCFGGVSICGWIAGCWLRVEVVQWFCSVAHGGLLLDLLSSFLWRFWRWDRVLGLNLGFWRWICRLFLFFFRGVAGWSFGWRWGAVGAYGMLDGSTVVDLGWSCPDWGRRWRI